MRLNVSMSITLRLTLLFAAASTAVLLLLGYLIGSAVAQHFEEQDMAVLTGKLTLAQHAIEKVRSKADLGALSQQLGDSLVGHQGLAMMVLSSDGEVLFATSGASFPDALMTNVGDDAVRMSTWRTADGHPLRGIAGQALSGILDSRAAIVMVATDITHHEHFMRSFQATLWSVVILAAILSGILGWIAARRGLAPLQDMRREVEGITARRLDARLSATAVPAELADLAVTLNEMLARLENSFRRLSNFSSDLAHELRTPVCNLLTQTQVTLSRARTAAGYRDILASNAEELERLSRVIADMLFLAKSDNDLVIPNREPVDLIDEVKGVFEFYEALSEEKAIVLTCTGRGSISGDRLMVRRAISNLLSNAVRHTDVGGTVAVQVDDSGGTHVTLSVANSGSSISPEHLPRVFDRFYRVDASRQRQSDGAGLGLAITRSILRAHGGDALAHSENGVTTFRLRFAVR